MVNLILFVFAVIGLTGVLVDSTLFMPVRDWVRERKNQPWCFINQILSCFQCCGVWTGWFCGACLFRDPFMIFMAGFAGSFLSSWAATYLTYLQARSIVELPPEYSPVATEQSEKKDE